MRRRMAATIHNNTINYPTYYTNTYTTLNVITITDATYR